MVVEEWIEQAACRGRSDLNWDGPAAWPDEVALCGGCPVRVTCLLAALHRPRELDYGILAGTTAHDRELIRRRKLDPRALWARQGYPYEPELETHGI